MLTEECSDVTLNFIPELCKQHPEKPLLISVTDDKVSFEKAKTFLENHSVPVYLPVEDACEALATMYKCTYVPCSNSFSFEK